MRGTYKKEKVSDVPGKPAATAAAVLKAVEAANKKSEKKANERATDKETIALLRAEVAAFKEKVSALEQGLAINIAKAKMEATAGLHEQLLKRYQEGLHDGASLTRGSGARGSPWTFATESPD